MSEPLSVADINTYLAVSGWTRQPEAWRGAAVWIHRDDHEILVPGSDHMGDGPRRIREIVSLLARVEGRSAEHVVTDIATPMADIQWYRTPIAPNHGRARLTDAAGALAGAHEALTMTARVVLAGPRAVFDGTTPAEVRALLSSVQIGPVVPPDDLLTLLVPVDDGAPLARRTLMLLHRTSVILRDASVHVAQTGEMRVFDDAVADGVSADLCLALARFAGPDSVAPFEVGFRWARGLPASSPGDTVMFQAGAGAVLRRAGHRLRRLNENPASATGRIGILIDNGGADRFRVQIRGDVRIGADDRRRQIWVRLPDEPTYDLAVQAHRDGATVHATGPAKEVSRRLELQAATFTTSIDDQSEET
ncbi:hypothetical protein [Herbidospora sp. RD11066]